MILYTFLVCLFCYLVGSYVALREAERDVLSLGLVDGFGAGHGSQGLEHAKRVFHYTAAPALTCWALLGALFIFLKQLKGQHP